MKLHIKRVDYGFEILCFGIDKFRKISYNKICNERLLIRYRETDKVVNFRQFPRWVLQRGYCVKSDCTAADKAVFFVCEVK